jgi:thioredoxin 1
MSDHELEKIRLKKAEELMKQVSLPKQILRINSSEEFDKLLNNYDKIIVIDFTAVWCGPCKIYGPIFERLHNEYKNDFIFVKVDVDNVPEIARRYMISGVPSTLFIRSGEIINKVVGVMNYDNMKNLLEKLKDYNH